MLLFRHVIAALTILFLSPYLWSDEISPQQQKMLEKMVGDGEQSAFAKQNNKDQLIFGTQNSFEDDQFQPIAGKGVLLVAGIQPWDTKPEEAIHVEWKGLRNMVEFEIVQGAGYLRKFSEYTPNEKRPFIASTRLKILADASEVAAVWLVTNDKDKGPTIVTAHLVPEGKSPLCQTE